MTGDEALALSKAYTKSTAEGMGSVQGKPCQIQGVTKSDGVSTVTFLWQDNSGTEHTSVMNVSDGADGQDGVSITGVTMDDENRVSVSYSDGTSTVVGTVKTVEGKQGEKGDSGYSPVATVTQDEDGATISVTDESGTTTATVKNGKDGQDGKDGQADPEQIAEAVADYMTENPVSVDAYTKAESDGKYQGKSDVLSGLSDDGSGNLLYNDSQIKTDLSGYSTTEQMDGAISGAVTAHNTSETAHSDIRAAIPSKTSALTNDSGFVTSTAIDQKVSIHNQSEESHADIRADIPTKTSQIENDSNYISSTQLSDALAEYSDTAAMGTAIESQVTAHNESTSSHADIREAVEKALTDAKAYTDTAIGGVAQFHISVVDDLPTEDIDTQTIYLVPNGAEGGQNVKTEYMYIGGAWEVIGSTEVDLSGYLTADETNNAIQTALEGYVTAETLEGKGYATNSDLSAHTGNTAIHVTSSDKESWNGKADDTAVFTAAETRENIVSGESHSTIFGKIKKWFSWLSDLKDVAFSGSYADLTDTPTIDSTVTNGSENAVSSHAVSVALSGKQDTEDGKGLSTNDYTDAEKSKLSGIAEGANKYELPTMSATVKGGAMVGDGLKVTDSVLSLDGAGIGIDDTAASADTTYSSEKIDTELNNRVVGNSGVVAATNTTAKAWFKVSLSHNADSSIMATLVLRSRGGEQIQIGVGMGSSVSEFICTSTAVRINDMYTKFQSIYYMNADGEDIVYVQLQHWSNYLYADIIGHGFTVTNVEMLSADPDLTDATEIPIKNVVTGIADTSDLGGVKIGDGLSVASDGTVSTKSVLKTVMPTAGSSTEASISIENITTAGVFIVTRGYGNTSIDNCYIVNCGKNYGGTTPSCSITNLYSVSEETMTATMSGTTLTITTSLADRKRMNVMGNYI